MLYRSSGIVHWKAGVLCLGLVLAFSAVADSVRASAPPVPAAPAACDPNWVLVSSTNPSATGNSLQAVAATGTDDVWAVGYYYESDHSSNQALLEHWTGTSWATVSTAYEGNSKYLYGVAAAGAGDVWAVGAMQTGSLPRTLTLHLSGGTWSTVPSPNAGSESEGNTLEAVTAIAPNDVWAVGHYYNSTAGRNETLALHWNGTAWSVVSSPNVGTERNELYGVAASGPNDVWAVGYYYGGRDVTLIEHWNGTAWIVVTSPNLSSDDHNHLLGVAVAGPNDAWAVGRSWVASNEVTVTEHWNGTAWSIVASPNVAHAGNALQAVAVASPTSVWAVGYSYASGGLQSGLVEHWNGTTWNITPSANIGTVTNELRGVTALATNPEDVWAVGEASDGSGTPDVSLIERYHPCTTSCTLQFNDVPSTSPFYGYVHCLACKGIVGGYADGTFAPGNPVTRGQLAKFIANAAGYTDTIPADRQTFPDVPPSSTFWVYVERVYLHGIVGGFPDGTFKPGLNVTRGQTAKFVANAAGYTDTIPGGTQTFTDVPPGSTFYQYVERVSLHGVVGGYVDGTFRPSNEVTRGQVSKFVANSFFPSCLTR